MRMGHVGMFSKAQKSCSLGEVWGQEHTMADATERCINPRPQLRAGQSEAPIACGTLVISVLALLSYWDPWHQLENGREVSV